MKLTAFISCLLISLVSLGQVSEGCCDTTDTKSLLSSTIFDVVENPPYFGVCNQFDQTEKDFYFCSDENVKNYIRNQKDADDLFGKMEFEAVILSTGCITAIREVSRTVDLKQREKMIKMLSNMPCWHPGVQNGKEVSCKVRIKLE